MFYEGIWYTEGMSSFSIGESIRASWQITKNNFGFLIVALLITGAVYIVMQTMLGAVSDNAGLLFLLSLLYYVLELLLGIGIITISIKLVDHKEVELKDLFMHYQYLFRYFVGSLLYGIIVFVGLILFIIPGIIWALKYQFFSYAIIDKNMKVWDAFKFSATITSGVKLDLLGLAIISMLINLVGMLALLVGLLVTIPLTMMVMAYVYRKLEQNTLPQPSVHTTPIDVTPSSSVPPTVLT